MVPRSNTIKYLGAWLDQHLSFKTHIKKKCQTAMMNLQRMKNNMSHVISRSMPSADIGTCDITSGLC